MAESVLSRDMAAERGEALRTLLGRPLIDAAQDPDAFRAVARHHASLVTWFDDACGWPLTVDLAAGFARLTKRTERPDATRPARRSRGTRQPFDRRRYELLCLLCAELTAHPVTTIGLLAGALTTTAAGESDSERFDSARHRERAAFVDALRLLAEWGVVGFSGGDVDAYLHSAEGNAIVTADTSRLYRLLAPAAAPSRIEASGVDDAVAVLSSEPRYGTAASDPQAADDEQRSRWRRHSVARRLLDDPVVHLDELTDDQRAYVASPSGRRWLRDRVAEAGFELEERAEGLLAVDRYQLASDGAFPAPNSNVKQVALLLTESLVVDNVDDVGGVGSRRLVECSLDALGQVVAGLFERHQGWAKEFREGEGPRQLASQAVDVLCAFGLAERRGDLVRPRPALARYRAAPAAARAPARAGGPTLWEDER